MDLSATIRHFLQIQSTPLNWDDLSWLWSLTTLPLIVKGICHPEDARRAKDAGVEGIYCANHGGRQANGDLPALDCLPAVVEAADGLPVLFDSGVRSGADIVKALALGATAVGVGRPYCYGLALGGSDGVVHVLRSLLAEVDLIMATTASGTSATSPPRLCGVCSNARTSHQFLHRLTRLAHWLACHTTTRYMHLTMKQQINTRICRAIGDQLLIRKPRLMRGRTAPRRLYAPASGHIAKIRWPAD